MIGQPPVVWHKAEDFTVAIAGGTDGLIGHLACWFRTWGMAEKKSRRP